MSKCTNSLYLLEKQSERLFTKLYFQETTLKQINPEYSLEGLMLRLKLQYFCHLMRRADSLERPWCWERLKAGGEGVDRGRDGWMASLTQWTRHLSKLWEITKDREPWCAAVHRVTAEQLATQQQREAFGALFVFIGKMLVCPNCTLTLLKWKLRFVLWKFEKYILCLG